MLISQTDTACDNYNHNVVPRIMTRDHNLILERMKCIYIVEWTLQIDFTIGELAKITSLEKSSVSARRYEMLRMKPAPIELGDKRKCRVSGIMCQTVRLV